MKAAKGTTTQVCEVMARSAPTIGEGTSMVEALRLLEETSGPVLIVDEGEVTGVVAEEDIRAFVEAMKTVAHIANRSFFPVCEDASVEEIAEVFEEDEELSAVPVFSIQGELVGAISREQIERALSPAATPAASDERARPTTTTVARPGRSSATGRFRHTLQAFRNRAAEIRKSQQRSQSRTIVRTPGLATAAPRPSSPVSAASAKLRANRVTS